MHADWTDIAIPVLKFMPAQVAKSLESMPGGAVSGATANTAKVDTAFSVGLHEMGAKNISSFSHVKVLKMHILQAFIRTLKGINLGDPPYSWAMGIDALWPRRQGLFVLQMPLRLAGAASSSRIFSSDHTLPAKQKLFSILDIVEAFPQTLLAGGLHTYFVHQVSHGAMDLLMVNSRCQYSNVRR